MLMCCIASDASSSSCSEHLTLLLLLLLVVSPLVLLPLLVWVDTILSDASSSAGHAKLDQLLLLASLLLSSKLQVLGGVMLPWRLQAAAARSSLTTAGSALCQLMSRWVKRGMSLPLARHVGSEPDSLWSSGKALQQKQEQTVQVC
jgi:hypothetical protein